MKTIQQDVASWRISKATKNESIITISYKIVKKFVNIVCSLGIIEVLTLEIVLLQNQPLYFKNFSFILEIKINFDSTTKVI